MGQKTRTGKNGGETFQEIAILTKNPKLNTKETTANDDMINLWHIMVKLSSLEGRLSAIPFLEVANQTIKSAIWLWGIFTLIVVWVYK